MSLHGVVARPDRGLGMQLRGRPVPVPVKRLLSIRRYVQRCSCRPARPGSRAGLVQEKDFKVARIDKPRRLYFLVSIGMLGSKWDHFSRKRNYFSFNLQREAVEMAELVETVQDVWDAFLL